MDLSTAEEFIPDVHPDVALPEHHPPHNFNEKLPVDSTDPDVIERYWYDHVYKGDNARQLTLRSALIGMVIGGVMSLSNLYVGLKTGWGMGVTITATILAFSLFKLLQLVSSAKIFGYILPKFLLNGLREEFSVLENNAMPVGGLGRGLHRHRRIDFSSLPALIMTTGQHLSPLQAGTWMASLSMLA